jgi:hypothetical protein
MLEARDLEVINWVCEELEALGYTKPRVSFADASSEEPIIDITFRKVVSHISKETS